MLKYQPYLEILLPHSNIIIPSHYNATLDIIMAIDNIMNSDVPMIDYNRQFTHLNVIIEYKHPQSIDK